MPTQKKIAIVENISKKLDQATSFFLTDYRGLTHQQLESLRRSLKKVTAEYLIVKNTLFKLALKKTTNTKIKELKNESKQILEKQLNLPTAVFLTLKDEISAIKVLAECIKKIQLPKIKIGFFSNHLVSEEDFKKLACLPGKNDLLAQLVMRLKSPIYGLHYGLNWNLQRLVIVLDNVKGKKH